MKYSIVIPVYKSGDWLTQLVEEIEAAMMPVTADFDLILVNDASPDNITWPTIQHISIDKPFVCGLDMLYNVGQFRATLCGIENTTGEYVITMDDDFQHPPAELPKLIRAAAENPEMLCIMGEYDTKRHSLIRNLGSKLVAYVASKAYNKPPGITTTSFRIIRRELCQVLINYRTSRPLLGPLIVQITRKVMNVPVEHRSRPQGRSGYRVDRLVSSTLDSIIYASTAPLRFFSAIGFMTSVLAMLIGAIYFLRWTFGGISVAGYTSLILSTTFFSGMILAAIGLVGEYVARVIAEQTGPPRYMIRDTTR
jgi:glycosyltransferase involved in cell wall biosynthesis